MRTSPLTLVVLGNPFFPVDLSPRKGRGFPRDPWATHRNLWEDVQGISSFPTPPVPSLPLIVNPTPFTTFVFFTTSLDPFRLGSFESQVRVLSPPLTLEGCLLLSWTPVETLRELTLNRGGSPWMTEFPTIPGGSRAPPVTFILGYTTHPRPTSPEFHRTFEL